MGLRPIGSGGSVNPPSPPNPIDNISAFLPRSYDPDVILNNAIKAIHLVSEYYAQYVGNITKGEEPHMLTFFQAIAGQLFNALGILQERQSRFGQPSEKINKIADLWNHVAFINQKWIFPEINNAPTHFLGIGPFQDECNSIVSQIQDALKAK